MRAIQRPVAEGGRAEKGNGVGRASCRRDGIELVLADCLERMGRKRRSTRASGREGEELSWRATQCAGGGRGGPARSQLTARLAPPTRFQAAPARRGPQGTTPEHSHTASTACPIARSSLARVVLRRRPSGSEQSSSLGDGSGIARTATRSCARARSCSLTATEPAGNALRGERNPADEGSSAFPSHLAEHGRLSSALSCSGALRWSRCTASQCVALDRLAVKGRPCVSPTRARSFAHPRRRGASSTAALLSSLSLSLPTARTRRSRPPLAASPFAPVRKQVLRNDDSPLKLRQLSRATFLPSSPTPSTVPRSTPRIGRLVHHALRHRHLHRRRRRRRPRDPGLGPHVHLVRRSLPLALCLSYGVLSSFC